MINEPSIDELINKLGEKYDGSKYVLCVVASKRARQLIDISKTQNSTAIFNNQKPLTAAACEIFDNKISVINN